MDDEGELSYSPPWRNVAANLFGEGGLTFGDTVTHEQLNEALGMPEPTTTIDAFKKWSLERLAQIDALAIWLLEERSMCLVSVHGQGYRVLRPQEQTEYAQQAGMRMVKRELGKMARRLHFVDRSKLTNEQAMENANAMARAAFLKQQLDKARRLKFEPPALEE